MNLKRCVRYVFCCFLVFAPSGLNLAAASNEPSELATIEIEVRDSDGAPAAGARVIPWAVRSALGHGLWRPQEFPNQKPLASVADAAGRARVSYPIYRNAAEQVRVTEVTLSIDHPEFAFAAYEYVRVPRTESAPHVVKLKPGGTLEIVATLAGRPAPTANVYAMCSEGRGGIRVPYTVGEEGAIRLRPVAPGVQQARLILLDGVRATHFSPMIEFEAKAGETVRRAVELMPAVRLTGRFDDRVSRPVRRGRVAAWSLGKPLAQDGALWFSWAPVAEDGSFVIEGWPAEDPIQLIALCDGFRAASGPAPLDTQPPADPDGFLRAQSFFPEQFSGALVMEMAPLESCEVYVVDQAGLPIVGAEVRSYPNVCWWNGGSQVYCGSMARAERALVDDDYLSAQAESSGFPAFSCTTNDQGIAALELPVGGQFIMVRSDAHELPIVRGERLRRVIVLPDTPVTMRLVVQPKGTELQGDWDKLSGVLFGCRGPECRRLFDNPAFSEEMEAVDRELDAAANPSDPALLRRIYERMAKAFASVEDAEEAEKWRRKAAQQTSK